jgi:hypothetical protein
MKGEYYCYHHLVKTNYKKNYRVLIDPEVTRMEIPPIEDRASIFIALAAVVHRLAENTIDTRRAGQMIYGLQVAMRALEPPRATRTATNPGAPGSSPFHRDDPGVMHGTSGPEPHTPSQHGAVQPATNNQQPATSSPRTIPISKESLLYFLRSRHCASCNAELFPAEELTERRNPGAPPEIIEEARHALPAPQPATDILQPATVLSSLQAVAENRRPTPKSGGPIHDSPTVMCGVRTPHSTFIARFALHSPRRSVSLRLVHKASHIPVPGTTRPHRILNQQINRRTKWQQ